MALSEFQPSGSALTLEAGRFEEALRQHVLDAWFPRCLDLKHGGFLCDFDRVWRECGPQEKLLEFQARQTIIAAEASQFYPKDEKFRAAAAHGLSFLRDVMWDAEAGGWFHLTDRAGRPLEHQTKHAHGAAYAIQAGAAVYAASGSGEAMDLARKGFAWLEEHAHDKKHGGYFGFFARDNKVILERSQHPGGKGEVICDTINTPIGFKDANVNSDLLETLTHLYRVWPDAQVKQRLAEQAEIVSERILGPAGMIFFYAPDWTPVSHVSRFGYEFQATHRLMGASEFVGDAGRIKAVALRALDHALGLGWDRRHGGFYYAGPGMEPTRLEDRDLMIRRKAWWVQAEALKTLLMATRLEPGNARYAKFLASHWEYLGRCFFDHRHGGTYTYGLDESPRWRRRLGAGWALPEQTRKGGVWKDASHDGRALLYCVQTLRGEGV